jgi:hypothetical protein
MKKMSITVNVSMQVSNFDKWKTMFDSRKSDREEAGINARAYRNVDEPNNACVIGTASTKETFVSFFSQPAMREALKNAGVLGPPEIKFLEEA